MKKLLFDFSRVLIFPVDETYLGKLNQLHSQLSATSEYKFLDHFRFNEELLKYLETNFEPENCFIFTTGTIQDLPESRERIQPIVKEIFSANGLDLSKKDPNSYRTVAELIGDEPSNIIYIDDSKENLIFAKEAGMRTLHFTDNEELIRELTHLTSEA